MPSNFDALLDELQRRAAERARVSVLAEVPSRRPDFGRVLKSLRQGARDMQALAGRMDGDPVLKAMQAHGLRAAESVRLEQVDRKIRGAVAAGSITAIEASKLEMALNLARARVG